MITPLRQAAIFSDFEARVLVAPLGAVDPDDLPWSAGACFASWGEAPAEALLFGMYQIFTQLTCHAGIPAPTVHTAFLVIPEYRACLPADHPDALSTDEWRRWRPMMDLPANLQDALREAV